METYLNIAELAAYIKFSEQTVRRFVLNRTVPYHKISKAVRFRLSEIETWIERGGIDGTVTAGPGTDKEGDLFATEGSGKAETAGANAGETGETCCPPAADSLGGTKQISGEKRNEGFRQSNQ